MAQPYMICFAVALLLTLLSVTVLLPEAGGEPYAAWSTAAVFAVALFFLLKNADMSCRAAGIALMAALVLMLCDAGYAAQFCVPDGAGQTIVAVVAVAACTAVLRKRQNPLAWLVLAAVCCRFAFSKILNGALVLCLLPAIIYMVCNTKAAARAAAVICAAAVLVSGAASMAVTPMENRTENLYNAVFYGALKEGGDPAAIGLSDVSHLAGTSVYDAQADVSKVEGLTYFDVMGYYATHPADLLREIKVAADNAYFLKPAIAEGKTVPAVWSYLKRTILPKGWWVILFFCGAYLVIAVREAIHHAAQKEQGNAFAAAMSAALPIAALTELAGAVITGGEAMLAERLIGFHLYFDLMLAFALGWGIATVRARRDGLKERYGVDQ